MTSDKRSSKRVYRAPLHDHPVAIIGMSSIFPNAEDLTHYWDAILGEVDCITRVPPSRWDVQDYYDPDPSQPDKSYSRVGGFIPDIDFNPMEFGLPPNILEVTDVSQLLALIVAKQAMLNAGYFEADESLLDQTGVVLGMVGMSSKLFVPLVARLQYPIWERVLKNVGIPDEDTQRIVEKIKSAYIGWNENAFPGAIGNIVAGRIANRLNLGGVNFTVDAACGSSLAAIKTAIGELVEGRADMMIAGGVDTDNSVLSYMCFSKTPAFSKNEHVRTFDEASDGMLVGEGLGMMVMKRLADAERDGDQIYAVIRGIGASSDGRYKSIYAPRPEGQAKALRRAYEEAGFAPQTIGLLEAHGTGTTAGDPAEIEGLQQVFMPLDSKERSIALGSIKSQIGHTKAAAGAAGMIKAALALHHKVLPATLNVTRPNPKIGSENSLFYVNTETRPWVRRNADTPRRAGVSAFGFGGTNFHIVMEEYSSDHDQAYRIQQGASMLLFQAATPQALLETCRTELTALEGENGLSRLNELAALSTTVELAAESARLGFVAVSLSEAVKLLQLSVKMLTDNLESERWEHPKGVYYRRQGMETNGKVVALFPGQGAQYINMGKELAMNFPPVRQVFAEMNEIMAQAGHNPLSDRIFPIPVFSAEELEQQTTTLTRTENAQPAIGSLSMGMYRILADAGFQPDFIAGHSFGELTALWAASIFDDAAYMQLAMARGQAMAAPDDPEFDAGTMLAVKGDSDAILEAILAFPEVKAANLNSRNQVVLAGPKAAITEAQQALAGQGFSVVPLPVSAAFHTSLVAHAQQPFGEAIAKTEIHKPNVPVYSNTTGEPYPANAKQIGKILNEHMLSSVHFKDEIENIYANGGTIFVEIGPKKILTNLVNNILADQPHAAVALNANAKQNSDSQLRQAVVQLKVIGLPLGNIDPYQLTAPAAPSQIKKSKISISLNGGLYVSQKTRDGYEQALNDGFRVQLPAGQSTMVDNHQVVSPEQPSREPLIEPIQPNVIEKIDRQLMDFQNHQGDTLRVHEQYLKNEAEFGQILSDLAHMQVELASNGAADPNHPKRQVVQSLINSLESIHDHQDSTARVHEKYLNGQETFSQTFSELVQYQLGSRPTSKGLLKTVQTRENRPHDGNGHHPSGGKTNPAAAPMPDENPSPVTAAIPAAQPAPAGLSANDIQPALLDVVSEKTGYPVEMLEMDMDMESDLGIDSIKRVEILGAMQERFPNLPSIEAAELSEMHTLQQIMEHLNTTASAAIPAVISPAESEGDVPVNATTQTSEGVVDDPDQVGSVLLSVVSEKTGYPVEMLEMDMDMESDLGIDSIKRVEILGAMQEHFPSLPAVDPAVLTELHTLQQIIQHLGTGVVPEKKG
ncbi:MAG: acyltransferase domain-containing protein [Anaerolineaceae bacterium]|nr:acyltransferase domain-containing protein [Anaerolineaceae bacterium]